MAFRLHMHVIDVTLRSSTENHDIRNQFLFDNHTSDTALAHDEAMK
jgi:hypothetical protein